LIGYNSCLWNKGHKKNTKIHSGAGKFSEMPGPTAFSQSRSVVSQLVSPAREGCSFDRREAGASGGHWLITDPVILF